jgi:TPR repeat protein
MNDAYARFDQVLIDLLADSRCALDHLNLVKHIYNRPGPQWGLLQLAERDRNHRKAPSRWPQAKQHLIDLAQSDDPWAMFHLGRWCRLGIGMNIDIEQAIQWFEYGAHHGHSGCMISLAKLIHEDQPDEARRWLKHALDLGDVMAHAHWAQCFPNEATEHLAAGKGLEEPMALLLWADHVMEDDLGGAVKALYQAAEQHVSEACIKLSFLHEHGQHGVPESEPLAMHWAAEAANLGSAFGCGMYGRMLIQRNPKEAISQMRRSVMLGEEFFIYELSRQLLLQGKRPHQLKESVRWLRHGAALGQPLCMNMLADMLRFGKGCKANPRAAYEWHQKAAELGDPESQVSVAIACMRGEVVPVDKKRAFNLLHLASLQEDADAIYLLGVAWERGDGTEKDLYQAHLCYRQAADLGSLKAVFQVGMNHFWGEGIPKDVPEGVKWIKKAADRGHADAQVFLGFMFRSGSGVTKNKRLARTWFQRAADQNYASGQYELAQLLQSMPEGPHEQEIHRLMSAAAAQGHEEAMQWIKDHWPEQPSWLKELTGQAHE